MAYTKQNFKDGDVLSARNLEAIEDAIIQNEKEFPELIATAFKEAKESGEFQGPPGPKGEDGTVSFEELTDEQIKNLKGEKGDSGVYVGDGEMPEDCNVQIVPDGKIYTLEDLKGKKGDKGDKGDVGPRGIQGFKGDAGYTPIRGRDYFTDADILNLEEKIVSDTVTQNTGDSLNKVMSQNAVTKIINNLTTLPYGGSKDWLENNGDKTKLYQIGGYVWGYIESNGWTKSDTQFAIVTDKDQMVNVGGTPYLLRNGNEGTVYTYKEASGDAGVTEYTTLPTMAYEGEIVAVGGRKYKATLTSKQVPNWTTNYADPSSSEWMHNTRCNSSGTTAQAGFTTTNIIEVPKNTSFYVKGFDFETPGYNGSNVQYPILQMHVNRGSVNNAQKLSNAPWYTSKTGDVYCFTNSTDGTRYYRFSGTVTNGDENVIITINEEITYDTETIVTWTDIGAYIPPVEAGWYATDESYAVIDSLSSAADSGATAVYSGDGFVYAYISGAAWMQTSGYSVPTLSIDGELSDSSENAVQNRIITGEINELKTKTADHTKDIIALNEKVINIELGNNSIVIPSFWQEAVDNCIAKIKALQVGKNCITFPFFSDNHQRNGYSGILISHIMKECGIPYAFFGGDTISSGYLTEAEMIVQDKAFDTIMSYIPEGRFCRAVGNHDGFWNDNGSKGWYTRNKVYELFLRGEGVSQNKHFGEDGTYYYVDDIVSKVRFIVLNTNSKVISAGSESIDSTQLSWLENTALSFAESGWGAVIISHCPVSNHYHANVYNAEEAISVVNNSGADIIGWFSGHIHRDRIYTHLAVGSADGIEGTDGVPLGFTQVTITSDHTAIAYDDATKHAIGNDALSHAIDFVTINKNTRMVNITRLGIGNNRNYSY